MTPDGEEAIMTTPMQPKDKHAELSSLQAQVAKLKDLAARAQADLQNYKARAEREAEELRKFASAPLLKKLLPVRDDLARAAAHAKDAEGFRRILQKLDGILESVGLRQIPALGEHVDPAQHEIIAVGKGARDVIVSVQEEGYALHGNILRPAKVLVGNGEEMVTGESPPRAEPTGEDPPPSSAD